MKNKAILGTALATISSLCFFVSTAHAYSLEGPKWQYPMDITWADGAVDQQAIDATSSWNSTPVAIMFYASNSNSADIQTSYGDFGNTGWTGNTQYTWNTSTMYFIPGEVTVSVNSDPTYGTGSYSYTKEQGVWAHEFGHSIGLAHNTTDQSVLMWPYDDRLHYTPQTDDINGGEAIYG